MTEQSPTGFPQNDNTINGPVTGPAVQAGAIHGGVHFHLNQTPEPVPEVVLPPVPERVITPRGPSVWGRIGRFVGRWFLTFLPLLVVSVIISGFGNLVASGQPLPYRLLADLLLLVPLVLGLWVWSLATTRSFRGVGTLVLDKATPRRITGLTDGQLLAVALVAATVCVIGLGQEAVAAAAGGPRADAHGPVLFLALLSLLTFRQRRLRKKKSGQESHRG